MNAWSSPSQRAYNLRILREDLNDFLPARIFDAHVHLAPAEGFRPGQPFNYAGVTITEYTYKELATDLTAAIFCATARGLVERVGDVCRRPTPLE